jgi:hypothetical protein
MLVWSRRDERLGQHRQFVTVNGSGGIFIAAVPGLVLFAELFARLAYGVDCTRVNGPSGEAASAVCWRQIIHDRAQSGVGFGLQVAVPGSSDKVVNLVITCAAQRPYQDFRLV